MDFGFLTRDSNDWTGELVDVVDVWAAPPIRSRALEGAGAIWMPSIGEDGVHIEQCTVAEAVKRFRTIPETDREVIRVPL